MKLKNLFHISAFFLILFNSCKQEIVQESTQNKLIIRLNPDSSSIELIGLASPVLEELRTDSLPDSLWTNFFAVYEEPDRSRNERFSAGFGRHAILLRGKEVRFKPKDNFRKNQLYFARCYTKLLLQDAEDLIETRELFISDGFTEYKFNLSKKSGDINVLKSGVCNDG
jgi:hypothetical protein